MAGVMETIRTASQAARDKITGVVQIQTPPQEETLPQQLLRQVDAASTLSWKQRAIGFSVCFGTGMLLSFLSLPLLFTLQVTKFAVIYTFGSVLSIASTLFLMGPCKQMARMMESGRLAATIVYVGSLAATLAVAFTIGSFVVVLLLLILQFLAMIWYCVTWIPGGQEFLKRMVFRS